MTRPRACGRSEPPGSPTVPERMPAGYPAGRPYQIQTCAWGFVNGSGCLKFVLQDAQRVQRSSLCAKDEWT
jgi:hypothetical protein